LSDGRLWVAAELEEAPPTGTRNKVGVMTVSEFAVLDEEWSIANPESIVFRDVIYVYTRLAHTD
jgi:hypothetical protein